MKTEASTDADQAIFLMSALRKRGIIVGMEFDDLGREWLVLGGALPSLGDASLEIIHQAREFHVELLAILAAEDAAMADASRPKPRKR